MIQSAPAFRLPPVTRRDDGGERRVGFELEFTGLTLEGAAAAVESALGGSLSGDSAAEMRLEVDRLGTFNVEIDWDYLKRKASEAGNVDGGEWIGLLKSAATLVVPVEVVCPPIPLSRLSCLHEMTAALRKAGAVGTGDSVLAAYGVHINAEAPSLEAVTVSRYLRAFALLQWWLVDRHEVDLSRKVTPYIDLYPQTYVVELLSDEKASTDELLAAYLAHNPTRNRALDMMPVLSSIDPDKVGAAVNDPRIKARPAFHYRLPNCRIEDPDWSLAAPWNTWVVVERMAADDDALALLTRQYLDSDRPLLGVNRPEWVDSIDRWLDDRGWV